VPRVLTVDDSRAIRQIVTKQLVELGCETDEAEDGEKGLQRIEEIQFDLILLDVTMPVMDGPEMLKRLRESGNKTPVIMLTSESKRSVVAGAMKLGIEDYILKPFKPEELRAKVQKVVRLGTPGEVAPAAPGLTAASAAPASATAAHDPASGGKQFVDVLVIDDMDNVQKKLRTLLPAQLSLNGCVSAQAALGLCRERVYRVILLDTVIPDVNSVALMNQLRALQQHSTFLALRLRTTCDAEEEARSQGYDGFVFKPFDAASIEDLLVRYFDNAELVTVDGNLMKICGFSGREERLYRYFSRLGELIKAEMEKIAAACHDEVIVDLSELPMRSDKTPRFVVDIAKQTALMGLTLSIVGPAELRKMLTDFTDTAAIPFFASVADAQTAKAA
jgi:DNA-binding response OmpR family regulator